MTDPWDKYFHALVNNTCSKEELKVLFDKAQREAPRKKMYDRRKWVGGVVW